VHAGFHPSGQLKVLITIRLLFSRFLEAMLIFIINGKNYLAAIRQEDKDKDESRRSRTESIYKVDGIRSMLLEKQPASEDGTWSSRYFQDSRAWRAFSNSICVSGLIALFSPERTTTFAAVFERVPFPLSSVPQLFPVKVYSALRVA
jgi:hypothetical protein